MKIELPWLDPRLSPNKGTHWGKKSKLKKIRKNNAFWFAKEQKTPTVRDKYHLSIVFHPPGNYGYDADNALATIKAEVDGIALAWGVNDKHFIYDHISIGDTHKGGKIIIELKDQ